MLEGDDTRGGEFIVFIVFLRPHPGAFRQLIKCVPKQIFLYRQDHNDKPMQKGAGSLETYQLKSKDTIQKNGRLIPSAKRGKEIKKP